MTQTSTVPTSKVKFATQLAPDLLASLREMAQQEGRQLQSILDEALREYIESKRSNKPRRHVIDAFQASMAEHDALYEALSK